MFNQLDSLDDEDIQEDEEEYRRANLLLPAGRDLKKRRQMLLLGLQPEDLARPTTLNAPHPVQSERCIEDQKLGKSSKQAPETDENQDGRESVEDEKQETASSGLLEGYGNSTSSEDESISEKNHLDTTESLPANISEADLIRLGLKDEHAPLPTISARDIRDMNWQYTFDTAVWSPARPPMEHGTMQKRKHQISWLASTAVEDEQRIQELAQKARDNKFKSKQRYGF